VVRRTERVVRVAVARVLMTDRVGAVELVVESVRVYLVDDIELLVVPVDVDAFYSAFAYNVDLQERVVGSEAREVRTRSCVERGDEFTVLDTEDERLRSPRARNRGVLVVGCEVDHVGYEAVHVGDAVERKNVNLFDKFERAVVVLFGRLVDVARVSTLVERPDFVGYLLFLFFSVFAVLGRVGVASSSSSSGSDPGSSSPPIQPATPTPPTTAVVRRNLRLVDSSIHRLLYRGDKSRVKGAIFA